MPYLTYALFLVTETLTGRHALSLLKLHFSLILSAPVSSMLSGLSPDQTNPSTPSQHNVSSRCCCVQSLSPVRLFATPWTTARQASLSFTVSWSLLKFISIESIMLSSQPILYCPLLLSPSIFPNISVFSNESAFLIKWPKYWSLISASVLPMNTHD